MKIHFRLFFFFTLIVVWSAGTSAAAAPKPLHVILISVDGLMPQSYTAPEKYGLHCPTLLRMSSQGTYSQGLQPVMPTVTYPSHTSMVTGVNPAVHGVETNTTWDPYEKTGGDWDWFSEDIKVPTIWDVAKKAHLKTAMVAWPVTLGAKADAVFPEFWRGSEMQPDDFKLIRALSTPGLLDKTEAEFPGFYSKLAKGETKDEAVTDIAVGIVERLKPELLLLHLPQVDHAEHLGGPWSSRAIAAIENADAQIHRVEEAAKKAGIYDRTIFVITSDHGFAAVTKGIRPGVLLQQKGLVTLNAAGNITDWKAVVVASGGSAYIYVRDPNDEQTKQTVLQIFQLPANVGNGISKIASKQDIATMGGDPDAFLALNGAPGFGFAGGYKGDVVGPSPVLGTHGYFPEDPAMQPSLIVYGPGIKHDTIENGHLIDIGPTITSWFGLKMPDAQGRALIPLKP